MCHTHDLLGAGGVGACFWLGLPWARLAFIFVPLVSMGVTLVTVGPQAMATGVMPLLIAVAIYNDTRNKLFFKEEVPRERLLKAWNLYMNNTMARAGFMLGLLGLLVPGVGLIVDPDAHPPIGRKGQAIAGIVLGALGCLLWGGLAYSLLRNG